MIMLSLGSDKEEGRMTTFKCHKAEVIVNHVY